MLEAPSGTAARRTLVDAGVALLFLALPILFGYAVLAPDRLALAAVPPPRPVVVGSIAPATTTTPVPEAPVERHAAPAEPRTAPPDAAKAEPPKAKPQPSRSLLTRLEPAKPAPITAEPPKPEVPRVTWAGAVSGRVVDPEKKPLAGASIVVGGRELRAADDGTFTVTPAGSVSLIVKLPGYARTIVEPTRDSSLEVVLKPQEVKAAYLTYYGVGDRGIRGRVLDLLARTELNAVVIDVKGDRGWVLYPTKVELAISAGAQGPATLREFDSLMADLKARGIYTIARIVTFKDNVLAHHRPDWAVIDTRTGKPWVDRENLAWVDPFREEVWSYNIALAHEAIERGFDEIQFDYVRFPTDGKLAAARYMKPVSKETRLPTIARFLERARRELGAHGAYVGADIFGYTAFNENDTDIGQRIEELAPHLDYICPMVYPSGYHVGIPGVRNPVANVYQVVKESVRLIKKRGAHTQVRVRPWLQDFRDYAFDRRIFGPAEVRDQIRGTEEGGGTGWMLWNPRNDYTAAALRGKGPVAAK